MIRVISILLIAGLASGCASINTAIHNLQFSGDAETFPADYNERAANYVAELPVGGSLSVSYPEMTLGETATSPKRWYVCVRGLAPQLPVETGLKPVLEAVEGVLDPGQGGPRYEVILIMRDGGVTSPIKAFDSPLCRAGRYEGLKALQPAH
jgi:hypothetical protein